MERSVSAYSMSHDWSVEWTRLPSNLKAPGHVEIESERERRALEAIAAVGLASGRQLFQVFGLDKRRVRRMVGQKRLVRHELRRAGKLAAVFTLGPGAGTYVPPGHMMNQWVGYPVEEVLKRILFFELYGMFPEGARVLPCASPFTGAIFFKEKPYYVYAVRGDMEDLLSFMKWNRFGERVLVVTERLGHLKPLDLFLMQGEFKMRAITDGDLGKDLHAVLHRYERDGEAGAIRWLPERAMHGV